MTPVRFVPSERLTVIFLIFLLICNHFYLPVALQEEPKSVRGRKSTPKPAKRKGEERFKIRDVLTEQQIQAEKKVRIFFINTHTHIYMHFSIKTVRYR